MFEMTNDTRSDTSIFWRIILVLMGFALAMLGSVLILSVFLAYIGLPLFIFGMAHMQAQES
jgi:hypothetical protein